MEKIISVLTSTKVQVLTALGGLGGLFINLIGGWGEDMITLAIFMGFDLLMGLLIAGIWKKSGKSKNGALSSWSAWKGLARKGVTLLFVLVANRLDLMLGLNCIRTGVIVAFCANELISITENAGIMGVPLPNALINAIDILKDKGKIESEEKKDEN